MGLAALDNRRLSMILWALVVLSAGLGAYLGSGIRFGDEANYINLADSIFKGEFSAWYFLEHYNSDTLRTFGYPLFLVMVRSFTDKVLAIRIVQFCLYLLSIVLFSRVAMSYGRKVLNGFLILVAINIQVSFYSGQVGSEILIVFLASSWFYLSYFVPASRNYLTYFIEGVILGLLFHVKPVYLLFPLAIACIYLVKGSWKGSLILLVFFFLTIIPFAFWNATHHGTFKLTPLQGGAGAAHLGFWQHKLPGYQDHHYWRHNMGSEPFSFTRPEQFERNLDQYEKEWSFVYQELAPFKTTNDVVIDSADFQAGFRDYSSGYVKARESALWKSLIRSIRREPFYWLKTRAYTAIRIWVTGINMSALKEPGFFNKIKAIVPFLITATTFIGLLIFLLKFLRQKSLREKVPWKALLFIIYTGAIHIPFCIQSRYSVPAHIFVLLMIAITILGGELKQDKVE